ncbi:MAG: hypothetical protein WAU39_04325 [Polyangiales bacterium]
MSNDRSGARLFPVTTRQLWWGVVLNAGAVVVGLTADSSSWTIRVLAVAIGVAVGFALRLKDDAGGVLLSLAIVLTVSIAMLTGTITLWLGFISLTSIVTGSLVRQIVGWRDGSAA